MDIDNPREPRSRAKGRLKDDWPETPHREQVRVPRQAKTASGRTLETDPLLLLRQYDRAMWAAAVFRRRLRECGYPTDLDQFPPRLREAWNELERAWEVYWSMWNRAPSGTISSRRPAPATPTLVIVLKLAGKTYNVMHDAAPWREIVCLIDVWHRYLVGQKILRADHSGFLHIGLLYEFGQALGVGKLTPQDLARRFSMSTTKIQSAIRRYQRTTKDRSVS